MAIVLPAIAMATDHFVGDDKGWTVSFDYQTWAKDKVFHVGDNLVFKYTAGSHNVFKVNATGFNDCIIPPLNEGLATGNDIIPLKTTGKKWYICGVVGAKRHCADLGMKLAITVHAQAPTPAPAPDNAAAFGVTSYTFQLIVAAMVFIAMIM
ncbi:hypothetical protein JRO89_XS04G0117400 [Xanthoceras sorbifolium]|uniref:Phytocyanin domain-containing protein n=1 Tax=Xanthoceras sorbifolium TaxID=99658 RepID=A0ABQ8I4Y3_9ROSI|nr:hypothetical protein JRO89_XS04G0117400 [Xanthoceras sorbifolium]